MHPTENSGYYESDRAVAEYLLFHFGDAALRMPWPQGPTDPTPFPRRCAALALQAHAPRSAQRALDLGCAVGGAAFELASRVPDVMGIDRSHRFIRTARRLLEQGRVDFPVVMEGALTVGATAVPSSLPSGHRLHFETGDALEPSPTWGTFDMVVAANLLDRVPDPRRLLERMHSLVRPEGTLVLISPYTWLEEYTPARAWLSTSGRRSREVLPEILAGFRLVDRQDVPFVLREHARKFQWSVAEATIWRRVEGPA